MEKVIKVKDLKKLCNYTHYVMIVKSDDEKGWITYYDGDLFDLKKISEFDELEVKSFDCAWRQDPLLMIYIK